MNKRTLAMRKAIGDRGAWLFFLFKKIEKKFGKKRAEEISRSAIRDYGKIKAIKDKSKTPKEWVKNQIGRGGKKVFDSKSKNLSKDAMEQDVYYCPLLERWKELGATKKEQDLMCDIAMEGDLAKAKALGFGMEIKKRMGKGDKICKFIIKKS